MALLPVSTDAWVGRIRIEALAEIYVLAGKHDAALDRLEWLMSVPSIMSVGVLQADPLWDPLRDNPRFQRLLERYKQ